MEIDLIRELISVQGWNHDLSVSERREWYERAEKAFAAEVSVDVELVIAGRRPAEWLRPRTMRTGFSNPIERFLVGSVSASGGTRALLGGSSPRAKADTN